MPLWYVLRPTGDEAPQLWAWTFAKSQKAENLERDPRATLQIEAGESYEQLRGVMLECDVTVVHRDVDLLRAFGLELFARYGERRRRRAARWSTSRRRSGSGCSSSSARRATWDHRKLGGVY